MVLVKPKEKERQTKMIKTRKKRIAKMLIFVLVITILSEMPTNTIMATSTTGHNLNNPTVISETVAEWDCVYFGRYWQNDTNGDGVVDKRDDKEPIKWRILSKNDKDIFLISDQNLDCKPYNYVNNEDIADDWDDWDENNGNVADDWDSSSQVSVTWDTSTLRSWLNGYGGEKNRESIDYSDDNFIDEAFTSDEQKAINETDVVNENNPHYDTVGGNATKDKIFLLSIAEAVSPEYGLKSVFNAGIEDAAGVFCNSCKAENSAYAIAQGANDRSSWWLRSPGKSNAEAAVIYESGAGIYEGYEVDCDWSIGVRPVLRLNTNASDLYSNAGAVSVEEIESTWDCIYFGHYRQDDTNKDGIIDEKDKEEPIKWRILSVNGDDAFILSDKSLDAQEYNNSGDDNVTWMTCTLRSWLNSTFYEKAFSDEEQSAINTTLVENKNNPKYGTSGGENTKDNIFLLSLEEVMNAAFGFSPDFQNSTDTRIAKDTDYTKAHVMYAGEEELGGFWWLRTPGYSSENAIDVSYDGSADLHGGLVWKVPNAVRPALHINLSSNTWNQAGTVTSNEGGQSSEKPPVSLKPEESQKPEGSSGNETAKPTNKPNTTASQTPTSNLDKTKLAAGSVIKDSKKKVTYKVLEQGKTLTFYKTNDKKATKAVISANVTIDGVKYKIVGISDNAFNGCKKLKSVTIGKNVKMIGNKAFYKCTSLKKLVLPASMAKLGKKAFYGCTKLKSISIKSKKLKGQSVGAQAFKGIHTKAVIKVPKKQKKTYQKWLRKKGITKLMKIK